MNPSERQQLVALLVGTSAYYGQELKDVALQLFVEDLEDLPFAEVVTALKELRRDPKTTRLPLPAVIRDRIRPAPTDENEAIAAANRVIEAVSKYGWCNADRAQAFVGELGWSIVKSEGGWRSVCEALTQDNQNTTRAQWRGLALSNLKRARAGTLHIAPALPEPMSGKAAALVASAFKQLPGGTDG